MSDDLNANINLTMDSSPAKKGADEILQVIANMRKQAEAHLGSLDKKVQKSGKVLQQEADRLEKMYKQSFARSSGKLKATEARATETIGGIEARKNADLKIKEESRYNTTHGTLVRKNANLEIEEGKRVTAAFRKELQLRDREQQRIVKAAKYISDYEAKRNDPWRQLAVGAKTSGRTPSQELFGSINKGLGLYNARQEFMDAGATQWRTGISPSQLWQQRMDAATRRAGSSNAAFFASQSRGVTPQVGASSRGRGNILTRMLGMGGGGAAGTLISSLAGGLGIGVGGYALANITRTIVEGEKLATSYGRQLVAARNLAGSQEQLNNLLAVYQKASGGAVSNTEALASTTRLLATGQAKTSEQFAKFVRGTRGASIALGRGEPEIQEQTQLAIANTSKRRLDQIGLGVKEVDERIEKLRKNNKSWNREMAFGEAIIDLLNEKYGTLTDTVEGQATGVEKLSKAWSDLLLNMSKSVKGPVDRVTGSVADYLTFKDQQLQKESEEATRKGFAYNLQKGWTGKNWFDLVGMLSGRTGTQVAAQHVLNNPGLMPNRPASGYIGGPSDTGPLRPIETSEEVLEVRRRGYEQAMEIERNYTKAKIAETTRYEEARSNLIAQFAKQNAREEEDFQRSRARSLRDYEKSIVDIVRDGQDRDNEMRADSDKQIAEIHEDSNKRLADIEENYQEQKEKSDREHRMRLLKAAGQLDAIALLEERMNWREENKDRKKQHDEQVSDAKESEAERVQDAKDALAERLEDARKADEKRLSDMAADRAQQLADEDEDRAVQKGRAIEDHNDQLAEMARQHNLTMQEIERQAEEQRTALEESLAADLVAVGVYIAGYTEKMEKKDKLIEEWLDKYIDKIEKKFKVQNSPQYSYDPTLGPQIPTQYALGGRVKQTGMAMVHAGEYVMSREMMSSGWNPVSNTYGGNSNSVAIAEGAITVYTTPGSELMVGELLEDKLIEIFGKVKYGS